MSKFTAAQLVEFYQKVADGGVMSLKKGFDDEPQNNYVGPNMTSPVEYWRIKPVKKIIDVAHFIKSGIDMEFSEDDNFHTTVTRISTLKKTDKGPSYYATNSPNQYLYCRPRMNHKMFHDGGACPIPEGFEVKLYFRDGEILTTVKYKDARQWLDFLWYLCEEGKYIIGYKILRLADGWAYPWECEE